MQSTGEMDLSVLLQGMSATLVEDTYVFATLAAEAVPEGLQPRMMFHEAEGVTLILRQQEAEAHGIDYSFESRMITLNVHSALEAVGFIARIATELAAHGMGVNPVAGYFHDHLFVPADRAEDAMTALRGMAEAAKDAQA